MNIQIILSILAGILIGVGVTLLVIRYSLPKMMQQQLADKGRVVQPQNRQSIFKRRSLFASAIIVGIIVIAVGLLVPLGVEADESHPNAPLTGETSGSPSFLFQYPGGWLTSGSNIYFDAGNVGINTAGPTEKLQVEGNIKLNGNITSDGDICIGTCN